MFILLSSLTSPLNRPQCSLHFGIYYISRPRAGLPLRRVSRSKFVVPRNPYSASAQSCHEDRLLYEPDDGMLPPRSPAAALPVHFSIDLGLLFKSYYRIHVIIIGLITIDRHPLLSSS